MRFRTYTPQDKQAIIDILLSNCPKYFIESDEADLVDFLDNYADENYLVAEESGQVIGCGGHYTKGQTHGIAWVMFRHGSIGHRICFQRQTVLSRGGVAHQSRRPSL